MDYNIDESNSTIIIKKADLNLKEGKHTINSFLVLEHIIAKCDLETQRIIEDAFLKAYASKKPFIIDNSNNELLRKPEEKAEEAPFSDVAAEITSLEETNSESSIKVENNITTTKTTSEKQENEEDIDEIVEIKDNDGVYTIIINNEKLSESFMAMIDSKTNFDEEYAICNKTTRKHLMDFFNNHRKSIIFVSKYQELEKNTESEKKNDDNQNGSSGPTDGDYKDSKSIIASDGVNIEYGQIPFRRPDENSDGQITQNSEDNGSKNYVSKDGVIIEYGQIPFRRPDENSDGQITQNSEDNGRKIYVSKDGVNIEYGQIPFRRPDESDGYTKVISTTVDSDDTYKDEIQNAGIENNNEDTYVTDNSQYKYVALAKDYEENYMSNGEREETLLNRLQKINSSDPIFIDEERIQDKNLTLSNAISLGKIKKGKLIVNEEPMKVNTKCNTILEMPKKYCRTLKNICDGISKKIIPYKIKKGLNQVPNAINSIGTFLAQMPREIARKISNGSKIHLLNDIKEKIMEYKDISEYGDGELAKGR